MNEEEKPDELLENVSEAKREEIKNFVLRPFIQIQSYEKIILDVHCKFGCVITGSDLQDIAREAIADMKGWVAEIKRKNRERT